MAGFEPRSSRSGRDRASNCAANTVLKQSSLTYLRRFCKSYHHVYSSIISVQIDQRFGFVTTWAHRGLKFEPECQSSRT